jgi:broad specificity phosphatase PhoE
LGAGHEIHECLLEVDVGDLEGESEQDQALLEDFFSVIEDWLIHKKNSRFPGGESWREVEERLKVLESMLFARPAVFVGHGALFMIFLGTRGVHFKKVEDLFLPRAGIARYLQPEQAWRIEKNCVAPAAAGPL